MLNTLSNLFDNIDYFAECASNVDIKTYKNLIRSKCISSHDSREEGAYFCAIPKSCCDSYETAVPILFINSLYEFEEWDKNKALFAPFDRREWKEYLKSVWIPRYYSVHDTLSITYKQVNCMDHLPIADMILDLAIPSPALLIVRYGEIEAWNSCDYLIETETEYITFQSWTNA